MTPPSAVTSLVLQTGRLQLLPSLQTLKKKKSQLGQTLGICRSILTKITLSLSLTEGQSGKPSIDLLNNPLEEVQSPKLLGLTIGRDLIVCWWRP